MKNKFGKFYKLLTIIIVFGLAIPVFAYETVICYFPMNQGWQKVYYSFTTSEAIAQFVPANQNSQNNNESVVFHSFKWAKRKNITSEKMLKSLLAQTYQKNHSLKYTVYKKRPEDSIASWCVIGNDKLSTQCELLRVTDGAEGIISIHYINKNKKSFEANFERWYDIVSKVKVYNSYYRWDRVLNKADTFEL